MSLKAASNKFNRGEIDRFALARDDVDKASESGELVENFLPMRLGPMMYRGGFKYIGAVPGASYFVPFVRSMTEVAGLEFTDAQMRIWSNDSVITRAAVTSSVTNGEFTSNITGWTDDSGSGSSTSWDSGGYLVIEGSGSTAGASYQAVSTSSGGSEHALRIKVAFAPVKLRLGTSAGAADIYEGTLLPGEHSLAFTPAGTFYVYFENSKPYPTLIDSVAIEGAGAVTLPCDVAEADLSSLRYKQSADVVYFAADGYRQFQVERRGARSWSLVYYRAENGPFGLINDTDITMTSGAITGDTTLTASRSYFTSDMVGRLFKLDSAGQVVTASVSAADNGTNSIRVTGVGNSRKFVLNRQGTFSATVTLQRSADDSTWEDVETYTTVGIKTYDDGFDNSEYYYRLWVKAGDYTSGTVDLTLTYPGGSISGIAEVTAYNSATSVDINILSDMGSTVATRNWYAGSWSTPSGYPSAVTLHEGRVWWGGKNKLWGSESDSYSSFDRDLEGASNSIERTIGFGPVDSIQWLMSGLLLAMGIASDEIAVRSSSFGEILTDDNVNLKSGSGQGSANVDAVVLDGSIMYVQRGGTRLHSLSYSGEVDGLLSTDLCKLNQTICSAGIKRIAVCMQPEPRVYVVLDDGEMRVYMMDLAENVTCWSRITLGGSLTAEDVFVLPESNEDRVYVVVNDGSSRYLTKMALTTEAQDTTSPKCYDFYQDFTSPGTTFSVSPMAGTVSVWADGQYREDVSVTAGNITVSGSWTNVHVGYRHTAKWRGAKVSRYTDESVLTDRKRVSKLGLIMANYWPGSVQVGPSFTQLRDLENIPYQSATAMIDDYDEVEQPFNGDNRSDPRVCLQANNPCTIMAINVYVPE